MDRSELGAWLRLTATPGIGRALARKLLAAFGSPEAVLEASYSVLAATVGQRAATALSDASDPSASLLETCWAWLQSRPDRAVLAVGDALYPSALLQSEDPPLLLYVEGQAQALQQARSLAIVGSRNPTPQGMENARALAHALSLSDVVVVSGLALGIDGAAHEGALQGSAPTVAVVGTGLDRVYPKRHQELARRIAQQGALVSEYALGTPPLPPHFPQRNRIIAGLTQGTLVVEAALDSGSLITAELALQMGREVFAIPGSIHAPQAKGCHALIRQGAKLVESAQDILEDLRWGGQFQPTPCADTPLALDTPDCAVLRALGFDPCNLDALQARTGMDTAPLQARLLELELMGSVTRQPGGRFLRCVKA